jgi:hypothetical protein
MAAGLACPACSFYVLHMPERLPAPYDRSLALACQVRTLRAFWLEVRCCRGVSLLPLQLMAGKGEAGRTLADVVVRLRCQACGKAPAAVALIETANAPPAAYGGSQGWRVMLIEDRKACRQSSARSSDA